jgi:carbon monoxide dehydrogenase subunit G
MRIAEHVDVAAPPDIVWEQVSDPARVLDFFAGVTRWECCGELRSGLGARYRVLMRVGSAEVGGLIETVEFQPERDLAWSSVTGIDQRGRWRLRETPKAGYTRVELRWQYGVAGGGVFGWLAELVASPIVRGNVKRTLDELKRTVEHEQQRTEAARRRAARDEADRVVDRSRGAPPGGAPR